MEIINTYLSGTIVPIVLFLYSIYFFIKLRGKPILYPKMIIKSIFQKKKGSGTSPIRAVIFALAGTLGVGNIVGVASAIALGGAGAVFWMWISAFLAMILKYCEVVLAVLHRRSRNGENYGGAMYYMMDFFRSRKKNIAGIIYTSIFTVLCLLNGFTMGSIVQSNAISESFKASFEIPSIATGVILAILCAIVFLFNGKKIFSLCEKLVPFVSILYLGMSFVIIFRSCENLPSVIGEIFSNAFSHTSVGAGAFGFLISKSLRYGTIRGLFSNEAGCGTSPIAHATSNTDSACEQGFLGIIEVFIDTILVCTVTAFVILLNNEVVFKFVDNPMLMVVSAFSNSLGNSASILLSISVFLFAFATIICWGHYGKECVYFISKNNKLEKIYYCFYILTVFIGTNIALDKVWNLADFAIGVMTLMNLYVLGRMTQKVKEETFLYLKKELP
jgi:AGCS family alanine or glycine:cation symporter